MDWRLISTYHLNELISRVSSLHVESASVVKALKEGIICKKAVVRNKVIGGLEVKKANLVGFFYGCLDLELWCRS